MHSAIPSKSSSRRRSSAAAPATLRASRLVGHSAAVRRLEDAIARVGHVDCPVLLSGETGSGKDEAARAIHAAGSRATRPFVAVNVRELRQTILRIAIFEDRLAEILDELEAMPPAGGAGPAGSPGPSTAAEPRPPHSDTFKLDELRRDAVRRALVATEGHYGRAAALLGVSPKTMTKLAAEARPGTVAKRGRRPRKPLPR